MKEYLTERIIEPLHLAILIMDLYIQVMIVCVYSFFINPNAPDFVDSTTIKGILIVCFTWRMFRESTQLMTTTFGNYSSHIFNWFDVAQIVLIILTLRTNLDNYSKHRVLIFATVFSWGELLLEIHNFNHNLAVFVVSIIKIMKRLRTFVITLLMFIATFAHAYYITGPDDKEVCNNKSTYTKEEFNSAGGFTCTRIDSYKYSFSNLFDFEIPSGFFWIQLLYFFVMTILLLNIIIAVVCDEFSDVQKESEKTFWYDRLEIVNELGGYFSVTHGRARGYCDNLLSVSKRIDLNLFLERSVWDGISEEEEKDFIHWWYGKRKEKKPPLGERLKYFFKHSVVTDIFIPASVFENVLLGKDRSERLTIFEKMLAFPFSIILMVSSNALFVIVVISGWLSFGILWPKIVKEQLFSVNNKIQKMTQNKTDEEKEISEMRKEISEMKKENIEIKNVNIEMKNENIEMGAKIEEILSGIKYITLTLTQTNLN